MFSKVRFGEYPSPLLSVLSFFVSEVLIMLLLEASLKDAILMIMLTMPLLLLFLYRPMNRTVRQLAQAKEELKELVKLNQLLKQEYKDELKFSEQRHKQILESLGVGIFVVNCDMQIVSWNTQMLRWFPQLERRQTLKCFEVFPDVENKQSCKCLLVETIKTDHVHEGSKRFK